MFSRRKASLSPSLYRIQIRDRGGMIPMPRQMRQATRKWFSPVAATTMHGTAAAMTNPTSIAQFVHIINHLEVVSGGQRMLIESRVNGRDAREVLDFFKSILGRSEDQGQEDLLITCTSFELAGCFCAADRARGIFSCMCMSVGAVGGGMSLRWV